MKKKPEKLKDLDALKKDLASAENVFLTGYEKMKVQQDFELRKVVRGAGGTYKVIKNTIAEKASAGTKSEGLLKELKGMSSIAYTSGDPVALAKALTAYAKANPAFVFKAAWCRAPWWTSPASTLWRLCRRKKRFTRSCCT
jgi:large subunit ribosomal protein L10